jgi:hypothetical protein
MKSKLILIQEESIEGVQIAGETILGERGDDGKIVAIHPDVTRGHIEARLRLGSIKEVQTQETEVTEPAEVNETAPKGKSRGK